MNPLLYALFVLAALAVVNRGPNASGETAAPPPGDKDEVWQERAFFAFQQELISQARRLDGTDARLGVLIATQVGAGSYLLEHAATLAQRLCTVPIAVFVGLAVLGYIFIQSVESPDPEKLYRLLQDDRPAAWRWAIESVISAFNGNRNAIASKERLVAVSGLASILAVGVWVFLRMVQ